MEDDMPAQKNDQAGLPQMSRPITPNEGEAILPSPNVYRLADHISGDRFGEQEFPAGDRAIGHHADRVLATVLFTDIVESTQQLMRLGDVAWRLLLDDHDKLAHRLVDQHRGRLIKTTGDGILASFDGPGRAIKCAMTFSGAAADIGLKLRSGLHTGEVEIRGDDIAGLAVNVAARIMNEAGPGKVFVSRVVTDLVAGTGVHFRRQTPRKLKGLPGRWDLFATEN
jgi:class 3 adenylate cyclase